MRLLLLLVVQMGQSCFPFPSLAASPCPPSTPTPAERCPPRSAARFSPLPAGLRSFDVPPASRPKPRGRKEAGAHRERGRLRQSCSAASGTAPGAHCHHRFASKGGRGEEQSKGPGQAVFWVNSSPSAVLLIKTCKTCVATLCHVLTGLSPPHRGQ